MLDVGFVERVVQAQKPGTHSLGFFGAYAHPEQMHFFAECGWIGKDPVVIGLWIEFAVSQYQHSASSAESTDIREEIQVIKRDLEGLHSTHRKTRHCAMIAV